VEPVFHLYVIQLPERDRVQQALHSQGIATGIHYPIPLHQQPVYARLGHAPSDFPITARLGPSILSLPMFPEITAEQIEQVVAALRAALSLPVAA
jgi:dTDP-4-amino-4,6-dideoxygalactose transaminase